MTYLSDLHSYLHHSSLLLQAYPTTRISTKYSLPRKSSTSNPKPAATSTDPSSTREKRDPSATLTLKTFHPESGICLKYRTDKAQEVGRLMAGLGRLAKGEIIEMPSAGAAEKMDVDEPVAAIEEKKEVATTTTTTPATASGTGGAGAGGAKKKKKGKGGK